MHYSVHNCVWQLFLKYKRWDDEVRYETESWQSVIHTFKAIKIYLNRKKTRLRVVHCMLWTFNKLGESAHHQHPGPAARRAGSLGSQSASSEWRHADVIAGSRARFDSVNCVVRTSTASFERCRRVLAAIDKRYRRRESTVATWKTRYVLLNVTLARSFRVFERAGPAVRAEREPGSRGLLGPAAWFRLGQC